MNLQIMFNRLITRSRREGHRVSANRVFRGAVMAIVVMVVLTFADLSRFNDMVMAAEDDCDLYITNPWIGSPYECSFDLFVLKWDENFNMTSGAIETIHNNFNSSLNQYEDMGLLGSGKFNTINILIEELPQGVKGSATTTSNTGKIKINQSVIDDLSDLSDLQHVASHELFHIAQKEFAPYSGNNGEFLWFTESTAQWAVPMVYSAAEHDYWDALDNFDKYHYLSLLTNERFGTHNHYYANFIFYLFISNHIDPDNQWMANIWTQDAGIHPLVDLDNELQVYQTNLAEAYRDFSAHAATWDFQDIDTAEVPLPPTPTQIWVGPAGTGNEWMALQGGQEGTTSWPIDDTDEEIPPYPQAYGYNIIRLDNPGSGTLHVKVRPRNRLGGSSCGKPIGSMDTQTEFGITIVYEDASGVSYGPVLSYKNCNYSTTESLGANPPDVVYVAIAATPDPVEGSIR